MTPLEELLDTLDQAVAPDDPPFLVAAFGAAGDGGVLVTDDDVSRLLGWQVPPECWAVGLVGGGTRIPLEHHLSRRAPAAPGDDDESDHMRLCCLVGRDGSVATVLRSPDGLIAASGEAEGRVIDALRRGLGLPTPPAEEGTADLLAILWLEDLLAAADSGTILGWPAAAGLHPAMRVLAAEGHDIAPEHFTMIARVATAAWSWENLRLQAAQEDWMGHLIPSALAGWMDEGMFARWLLGEVPSLESVTLAAQEIMDPGVWHQIATVIRASGAGLGTTDPRDGCLRNATPGRVPRPRATPRN